MNTRTIPHWKLPQFDTYAGGKAIAVFFLCQLDDFNIAEICNSITAVDISEDFSAGNASPVVPVRWVHNCTPQLSAIHDIGGRVFVDEKSVQDKTAIIINKRRGSDTEIARVPLAKVNRVWNLTKNEDKSLLEFVPRESLITVEKPVRFTAAVSVYHLV